MHLQTRPCHRHRRFWQRPRRMSQGSGSGKINHHGPRCGLRHGQSCVRHLFNWGPQFLRLEEVQRRQESSTWIIRLRQERGKNQHQGSIQTPVWSHLQKGLSFFLEWMGWTEEWMDGRIKGWMEEWKEGWLEGWMEERKEGWMEEWIDGWADGWMDEWMDGWMDGWEGR